MVKRVLVLYGKPNDAAEFDRYYREVHVPLVRKMPKLKGFEVSRGPVAVSDEEGAYHLVVLLTYDGQAELEASLASPEGVATIEDVANFATGGVRIVTIETEALV